MIQLDVYNKTRTRVPEKPLHDLLRPALRALVSERICKPNAQFSIELTFVGDRIMSGLNAKYHNKNRPTDVISLSFLGMPSRGEAKPISAPPWRGSFFFAGEIFISLPYARRQANRIGQPLLEELRFLFIHGLLHVFGYDHKKPDEEVHMKKLTYRILGRT